jgi:flagellar hook-associated protein 1 FlgK
MSITASLSNALSGLTASSRSAEVISANLANALTEGYGRREIHLEPRWVGGNGTGVSVAGVTRETDSFIIAQRRLAAANLAHQDGKTSYFERLEASFGKIGEAGSLTSVVNQFETALIEAASRPDSTLRLDQAVGAARDITGRLNQLTGDVQGLREQADRDIAGMVAQLNDGLDRVHQINAAIRANSGSDADVNRLLDQRQITLDRIAEIVPIRTIERGFGQVAIYTEGGAILLDGQNHNLDFVSTGTITADMTVASGALGQISLRGRIIDASSNGPLSGGALGAAFEIRDNMAVQTQMGLDAIARDLIERFAGPGVDPTLSVGDEGLFTDTPTPFVPANEASLAGRISVNALVDPAQSGASWRLRDGLGALVPGDTGNAVQLNALIGALTVQKSPASGLLGGSTYSFGGHAGGLMSLINSDWAQVSSDHEFAAAQHDTFKQIELRNGVDSDEQMQKLLLVEQAFTANARVVQTADEMIQTLLRL